VLLVENEAIKLVMNGAPGIFVMMGTGMRYGPRHIL